MIEQASRMRHLTESLPLQVYNSVFSAQPEQNGAVCYYDATADDNISELPPSRASEVRLETGSKRPLLSFD